MNRNSFKSIRSKKCHRKQKSLHIKEDQVNALAAIWYNKAFASYKDDPVFEDHKKRRR